MWWIKTRDLVVETCTIVKALERDFKSHVLDGVEKYNKLCNIIQDCHESCPESENFQRHTIEQNGTLKRIEAKYDVFYEKHSKLEQAIDDMRLAKKTKKEVFAEIGKVITIVCIVLGAYFGWQKYCDAKKSETDQRIEIMLQKLINK
jgi:hypothetical protein